MTLYDYKISPKLFSQRIIEIDDNKSVMNYIELKNPVHKDV